MIQVRHKACGQRLFDSLYGCVELTGSTPDIAIKCSRCSRKNKKTVIAKYRMQLPRWIGYSEPRAVYCADVNCLTRISDVGLPVRLSESGHIQIACPRCHRVTHLLLEGVISIA